MDKRQELMGEFMDLFNEIVYLNKPALENALKGYKLSEIEMIEHIEKIPQANVTKLAQASYMTRGAISKLSKKLMEKGLIESYQNEENKKEIYFKLTKKGKELNQKHEELHEFFMERDKIVFEPMKKEEYDTIFRFIGRYRQHLKNMD